MVINRLFTTSFVREHAADGKRRRKCAAGERDVGSVGELVYALPQEGAGYFVAEAGRRVGRWVDDLPLGTER